MVLPYLKGFLYFLCSCYGEGFMVYSWLFLKYICRSIIGQDIEVLKFAIFQGFFRGRRFRFFYFCGIWRLNLPK
jgi:hypothetical protein